MAIDPILPSGLLLLLHNTLVLRQISPYLSVKDRISLAATSKAFRYLIFDTPQVFQYVNLFPVASADRRSRRVIWRNAVSSGPNIKFPSPIIDLLQRKHVLSDVRTLVLDGLAVSIHSLWSVLCHKSSDIRILSIRGVSDLSVDDLLGFLRYLIRPSRPPGVPKLKGIYFFGEAGIDEVSQDDQSFVKVKVAPAGVTTSIGATLGAGNQLSQSSPRSEGQNALQTNPYLDSPYQSFGISKVLSHERMPPEVPDLLLACAGLIAFDAILCRHNPDDLLVFDPRPKIATVRLSGCQSCGSCPEGPARSDASPESHLPLLSPPPMHSSTVKAAQISDAPLIVRCRSCLKDRWCERCNYFICERCYTIPKKRNTSSIDKMTSLSPITDESVKVYNGLCVSKCLIDELLNGVGEGGMWG